MAVKAINNTAGLNGLVLTLLVFGAYPRIVEIDPPAPNIIDRTKAVKKAMAEVAKLWVDRQITDALRQRNGPQIAQIKNLPINSKVLVWREEKAWTGLYILIAVEDETYIVELLAGPT